ncbi:OmpA family protein [Thiomicrorhabdus sp. 6S2-11]|jgi:peptidoglycan-associated lipoprotein|uniref:Peptidoglycan-associated lipoprotein n=1 Tax=Thiomicrorhabdus marina TaxID=2818442 RepID=A0ABS3Q134_9GAMM|nr:OmpA family protein [Thiomicrorhabdus marina]MBO1926031.1 OmpA family protein [Thiomicrorhabdus marina]
MKTLSKLAVAVLAASLAACSTPPQKEMDAILDGDSMQDTAPGLDGRYQIQQQDLDGGATMTPVEVYGPDGQLLTTIDPLDGMQNIGDSDPLDPRLPEYKLLNALHENVVYFGYDQYSVDEKGMEVLRYYADVLAQDPRRIAALYGHTDERGSPEYNLALGEKRAKAVFDALVVLGIDPKRLGVSSMGEEEPAVFGSNESVYAKNRRVEIILK